MDVLVHLAAHAESVVSKQELLDAVWRGAFVEEGALAQAIHSLRKALADDARQPRYIQTVPKRGYRLIAPVAAEPAAAAPVAAEPAVVVPVGPAAASATLPPGRRWTWLLVAVTGLAVSLALALIREGPGREAQSAPAAVPAAGFARPAGGIRIAVQPFEDLGPAASPYFTAGLTQELLKDLGSLPALQVIYRPVSPPPGHQTAHPPAGTLGADYVLSGTVQWEPGSGGRPRAAIRALLSYPDGVYVWGDTFESDVEDVFAVQAEISRRVIGFLGITLLPGQDLAVREPSTRNPAAHEAYLRGLSLKEQPFYSEEALRKAALNFQRAVDADPGFAAAWAELSLVHSNLAYNTDPTPDRMRRARQALEKAEALAPDLPEVWLARAYYVYRCQENYEEAFRLLTAAARRFPNEAEVFKAFGALLRRRGQLPEAIEAFRHAEWLDPRTGELVWLLPETYRALRNFAEADRGFARAIDRVPDEPFFWEQRALNLLVWKGDPVEARRLLADSGLAGTPEIEAAAFRIDLYEGKLPQALERFSQPWVQKVPPETGARLALMAAVARDRMGDARGALAAAEANRVDLEEQIERYPKRAFFRAGLAVAYAQLDRRREALDEIEQAARMRQIDAFSGPRIGEIQALVDVLLGRHPEAISRLARLLETPYRGSITVTDLRLDPFWEPLRGDPAFEALVQDRTAGAKMK